jgi:capsular exopolysaccharide synthesis family protein
MNNNSNQNNGKAVKSNTPVPKREKTILEIFQMIMKNKYILLGSIALALALALIYAFTATPLFESTAVLKKEANPDTRRFGAPDISTMLSLQSLDEIETEMQLIKTHTVMSQVAEQLNLFLIVKSIEWKNKTFDVNDPYLSMIDPAFISKYQDKFLIPEQFYLTFNDSNLPVTGEFRIKKISETEYELFDNLTGKKISKGLSGIIDSAQATDQASELPASDLNIINESEPGPSALLTDHFKIDILWNDAPVGSEINFTLNDLTRTALGIVGGTKVSREGKTDIFRITFSSNSSNIAAVVANTIVEKFRESRMQQKKDAIRYSFDFVDNQLGEIQDNLKRSEDDLSRFKASGQIMTIDASSQELIGFLSRLEAEKLQTDLQLADYKNRVSDLEKELRNSGFFDQSYLNPDGRGEGNTPFSQLMSQLANLELQKLEMLQRRTENHPDVKAIDDQINLTRTKLAGFNENTITAYRLMINTLEKKLLKITDLMSKYEVKMQGLPAQENKLAQLLREKGTFEKIYTILLDQREAMRIAELSRMQDITIIDEAKVPRNPSWPKKQFIVMIGAILGGFGGLMLIFFVELYRTKYINIDELEDEFQVPVLALIPKFSKKLLKKIDSSVSEDKLAVLVSEDEDGLLETYRLLKTKLYQNLGPENKIVMITSCEENSGKTTVAANLAVIIAQEGKRVLLIDCDLRKAELSKFFGLNSSDRGLLDFLTKDATPKIYNKALKMIDILPAGGKSEDSGTLLNSNRMKALFNSLDTAQYDLIIVDTPPVTRVVDPLVLAHSIKNAVVVVRQKHTFIETVRWGMSELQDAKINVKGIVANAVTIESSYYYRYRYGYGYGYGDNNNGKIKSSKFKGQKKTKKVYS